MIENLVSRHRSFSAAARRWLQHYRRPILWLITLSLLVSTISSITALHHHHNKYQLMQTREEMLQASYQGLVATGLPLVSAHTHSGTTKPTFAAAAISDDVGMYYFIPEIAVKFSLSLEGAKKVYINSLLILSFLLGSMGFCFLFRGAPLAQATGAIGTLAALVAASTTSNDTYVAQWLGVSCIPLVMYLIKRIVATDQAGWVWPCCALVTVGIILGSANLIRGYAGMGIILFSLVFLLFTPAAAYWRRGLVLLSLCLGFALPIPYKNHLVHARNTFLQAQGVPLDQLTDTHPFWHSIYIGLGYVSNPYGIKYKDEVGIAKAKELNPKAIYPLRLYEQTLKQEVFRIAKKDPTLILRALAAKCSVTVLKTLRLAQHASRLMLLLAMIGVLLMPQLLTRRLFFSFACIIGFGGLSGVLVYPAMSYFMASFTALILMFTYLAGETISKLYDEDKETKR